MSKFYIEIHSTMTDDTFFFVGDDCSTVEACIPVVKQLIHAPNEDYYVRTMMDLELNGLQLLDDRDAIDKDWDCVAFIEDRF